MRQIEELAESNNEEDMTLDQGEATGNPTRIY